MKDFPVAFVCPSCKGPLARRPTAFECVACQLEFPIVAGIPDFRLVPDPWIGIEADREKGLQLEAATAGLSFENTVRAYWAMTPTTAPDAAARFIDHVLTAPARTGEWLGRVVLDDAVPTGPWLDVGCGTADVADAAPPDQTVVGIDVAFRWLIVARRRLIDSHREAFLVCCNAEHLPFPAATFSRWLSLGVLEHCRKPYPVLAEAARVLRRGGRLALRTVNRFSLLPEPHVGLWGIGFLPRRWGARYVAWRTGRQYLHRPLGAGEIARAASAAGLADVQVQPALLLAGDRSRLGPLGPVAGMYQNAARVPVARHGLRWIAPLIDTVARVE